MDSHEKIHFTILVLTDLFRVIILILKSSGFLKYLKKIIGKLKGVAHLWVKLESDV